MNVLSTFDKYVWILTGTAILMVGVSLLYISKVVLLHWMDYPKNFSGPGVLVSISAPERTFAKQGVNEI